jgi:hypothetical protein
MLAAIRDAGASEQETLSGSSPTPCTAGRTPLVALPGQFGTAGRNSLRGPAFAEFDLVLQKGFQLSEGARITFGAEAYNLLHHPNFGVSSNTQARSPWEATEAIFKDAAGDLADNVGRIFSTVGSSRQIQLDARFTF